MVKKSLAVMEEDESSIGHNKAQLKSFNFSNFQLKLKF